MMYDIHPFNRSSSGEPWKEIQILKSYHDTLPNCYWRVQDLINANIQAGLMIREVLEIPAVAAFFCSDYEKFVKKEQEELVNINSYVHNPTAILPSWISIISRK